MQVLCTSINIFNENFSFLNFLGLATIMAVFTLRVPDLGISSDISDTFDWLFTIFLPNYCLGQTLMNMYVNYEYIDTCTKLNYEFICALPNPPIKSCCRGKNISCLSSRVYY